MKKVVRIIALFLVCTLLGGCTSAEDVSALISKIGTVTLDSGDAIAAAEDQYDDLFFFDKKKVENYDDLVDARTLYDEIVSKNDRLNQLADQLGELTADSKEAVTQLKEEYYGAILTYGYERFPEFAKRLEEIETQFAYCELEAKLEEAEQLCEEKNYLKAWGLAQEVYDDPNGWKLLSRSSTLITRCIALFNEQVLIVAQQSLDKGDPFGVLDALDMLTFDHSGDATYQSIYTGCMNLLEELRPKNGAVLDRNLPSGKNVFKISVPSDQDYCLRLESESNPGQYVMFYAQGGKTASVKVPSGTYKLKYVCGNYWCGAENYYFYEDRLFFAVDTSHTVKSTGSTYTQVKISLMPTQEGNMTLQPISRYYFDGYEYTKPTTDV